MRLKMQLKMNHTNNDNNLNGNNTELATNSAVSAPGTIRSHVVWGDYIDSNDATLVPNETTSIAGLQQTVQDSPHHTIDESYHPQLLSMETTRFRLVEHHPESLLSMHVPYIASNDESFYTGSMTTFESYPFLYGSSTSNGNRSMQHTTRLVDIIDEVIRISNNSEEHLLEFSPSTNLPYMEQ